VPTYEYACKSCGEHCEVVQSFKDEPLTECPHCQGQLRKVFGNIGIAFKGSGFYKTDSRSKSSGAAAAKSADGSSGSGSESAAGKTEAKAESKGESKGDSKGDSKSAPKGDSKRPSGSSTTPSAASAS
jgi:putative FmdB family regulatory protein